ncbi:MAG TPA: YciI family protein [Vicinamibacterales bacterium]
MRFMIIRKADKSTEAGVMPSEALLAAMLKYNEELMKAGVLLQGEGLQPSSKGFRVRTNSGKPTVVDGPFTETKELIAGFTMIQVRSREEAIEWVKRWPAEDGDAVLEVRQVFEADDFGTEFTPELREREERLRAQAAKQ